MKKKANNHDRDRKNSGKKKSGNHRPSDAHREVRSEAANHHGSKRTAPSRKGGEKTLEEALPRKAPQKVTDQKSHDELLISRAHSWAELHANPKTRDAMDRVLEDLSKADQRRVVLCGQRIVGGLSVKLVK